MVRFRFPPTVGYGHEDAFARPRLSARYRFSEGTLAGAPGNGRDAPKAALPTNPLVIAAAV